MRAHLRLALVAVVVALSLALSGCLPQGQDDGLVLVTRVIDGDTVVIEDGRHVRYIGVDTPERGEAYYEEARQLNRSLVEGKKVRLERDVSDTDRYGRLLRYVYAGDTFVNAALVEAGLARARGYPPDLRHRQLLERTEGEAREKRKGMWQSSRQPGRLYLSVLTSWTAGFGGRTGASISSHLLNQSRTLRSTPLGFIVTLSPLSIPPPYITYNGGWGEMLARRGQKNGPSGARPGFRPARRLVGDYVRVLANRFEG